MTNGLSLSLTFQGGTDTIGGNAVVLAVKKRTQTMRFLFDFGVCMSDYQAQRTLKSEPRSIEDMCTRGLIPKFDTRFKACFLSHAHPDHYMALIALYNSKRRPSAIWATNTTSRLVKDIRFEGRPLHLDPFKVGDYYEYLFGEDCESKVRIALYPVDHDVPGACCFFAVADNHLIIYTGDFRDHGFLSSILEKQFWQYAKRLKSKTKFRSCTVVCEGTNFGLPFAYRPQKDFDERLQEILDNYKSGLVSLIINKNGLWDLFSAIQIASSSKSGQSRAAVLSRNLSRFLDSVAGTFLEDYRRIVGKESFDLFRSLLHRRQYEIYDPRDGSSIELLRTISKKPSEYLLFLTPNDAFAALEKIARFSGKGGCCILSFTASEIKFESTVRTFAENIGNLGFCVEKTNALARGHVSPHRLVEILGSIDPTKVFVIHTLTPGGLQSFLETHLDCDVIAPSKGVPYDI